MGGTFLSLPEEYRNYFVAQLHNSLSGWTGSDVDEAVRFVSRQLFQTLLMSSTGILPNPRRKALASRSRQDLITALSLI
jgi:hypothetical protein